MLAHTNKYTLVTKLHSVGIGVCVCENCFCAFDRTDNIRFTHKKVLSFQV
jgi:hypothetical protein